MFRTKFDEKEKLWSGCAVPPLYNPKISIGQALLRAMKLHPKKIAQISANNEVHLTYNDLYNRVVRAAQNIRSLNFEKGDVFAVVSKNNHELVPLFVALLCLEHPFNPVDPSSTEEAFMHMFSITKPKLVFCDIESYEMVRRYLRKLNAEAKIYTFCGQYDDSIAVNELFRPTNKEAEFIPTVVDGENDIAVISCSSGTTGLPKPIRLTHAAILDQVEKSYNITADDILLSFSLCSWITGMFAPIVSILHNATRIITTDQFTPELMLKLIEKYKVTFMYSSTFHWMLVLKTGMLPNADLTSLRQCAVTGTKLPLNTALTLMKYIPNAHMIARYGLTERGTISVNDPFSPRETVGRLNSGVQVKIIDEMGNRLGIGEEGEICVKTPYKFAGYLSDGQDDQIFYDSEGFLRTADVGRFDADGFLDIFDRKRDLLFYLGCPVSPTEIETFLLKQPEIKMVCVVAVNDTARSEIEMPAAVVVRSDGANISEGAICGLVANNFENSKRLRGGVYFVETLPTNTSGKILRRQVKQIATDLYNAKFNSKSE